MTLSRILVGHKRPIFLLVRMLDPFIFSSQATQVFFANDVGKEGWKVVLHKEARPRREFLDTSDVFVSPTIEAPGLATPQDVSPLPIVPSLVAAIELTAEDSLLASAGY